MRIINEIAQREPKLTLWVITRIPDMAAKLQDLKSIKILFSLDASTPEIITQRAKELKRSFKHAKFRFSWVRDTARKAPRIANIIFNKHIGRKKEAFSSDERTCHATLPNHNHSNSCDSCRRCFA